MESTAGELVLRTGSSAAAAMAAESVEHTLTATAARLVFEGLAENTRAAYAHDWTKFIKWCTVTGRNALPATGSTLTNYVAHLAEEKYAPSTIDRALACILAAHDHAQLAKPNTKEARLALRAYRREQARRGQRKRKSPPITIDRLRSMITATPADTALGIRDRAVLVLGFALMGRRSELAACDIGDLTFTPDGLEVYIATSKTDQDAHGETVAIPYGSHPETCPVRVLQAWLLLLAEHGITTGALLRPVDRHGRIGDSATRAGRGTGTRITDQSINLIVKRAAAAAHLEKADGYSAHGLRAGGATSAAKAGAPMSAITAHGRWAEGSPVVAGYIRQVDKWNDNPMRGVGL
ncbi:site-specific integrase [Streptosporangium subroseum]|uniref:site-specific integrase n=1 Tax=Streptosporangium subroseum TaxID=106412 RepID=UPI003092A184|nr:tyrosine-type recombinase/integrase [Streptosporangium subroseum]